MRRCMIKMGAKIIWDKRGTELGEMHLIGCYITIVPIKYKCVNIDIKNKSSITKKRNILAHTTQENIENSFVFRNIEDETKNYILTEDECLSLRKLIIEIGKCLNEI